ncbi:alpha/beta fold hydrolase [Deinococcus navajonensis]|uniref:Alpha/beta fold hydrolase n=1 Tax=Deinococcus navajonensis TaxID=309884 RepID=A0ABV8XMZ9_9DEIO
MNRTPWLLGLLALGTLAFTLGACAPAPQTGPADGFALRPALAGERRTLWLPDFGPVVYYADPRGQGRPLVLTHSVNAAASAYEVRPLWNVYAGTRPVYALEWPGFGSSSRPDVRYTPELMARSLAALIAQLNTEVDVVALSLGSEFAARVALDDPRVRSLALISPSGFGPARGGSQQAGQAGEGEALYRRLNSVGGVLYSTLRTRPSLQYFLSRSFRGPVPGDVVEYAADTSRQPGARYAPLYFISGQLFHPDAFGALYSRLTTPTLVLYDQDAFVSFDRLPAFAQQPNATVQRIAGTDGLPHFEKLADVKAALDTFWIKIP